MPEAIASNLICSECAEPLGRNGICVACLLRAGLDDGDTASGLNGHTIFGDFEVEQREDGTLWELGRGAMGTTYRATDKVLNRSVALKVIVPPSAIDSHMVRERFLREARAAAGLRHPNIAAVFQFGAAEGDRCYCAMELVDGETLDALVRRDGPLPCDTALDLAIQVTRALIAATERNLVHRDLKPGNIMLAHSESGQLHIKVIDFGVAKAANAAGEMELTHSGFVGTPAFASPEQFAHGAIDARTDIYALGVTLWFALTGRLPFAGTTIEEIRERQAKGVLPTEQLKARAVPPLLIELLRSCLAVNPAERPASARELMSAIEACRAQIVRPPTNRKVAWAAFGCIIVAAAISGLLLLRPAANKKTSSAFESNLSTAKQTENGEAYLLYLRGVQAETSSGDSEPPLKLYRQAVALDPQFALALARLSITASNLVYERNGDETLAAEAKRSADQAQHLAPNLPEAYVALATYYLSCKSDGNRALAELKRAAELAPDSAELHLTAAFVYKNQNRFRERIAALRRAEVLDPQNIRVRSFLVRTYRWVRDWPDAIEALDRRVVVTTGKPSLSNVTSAWSRANDEFRRTSDINALKQGLAQEERQTAPVTPADRLNYERFEIAMLERDHISAAQFLGTIPPEIFEESSDRFGETGAHLKPFYEALLAVASNTSEKQERLERAENAVRSVLQNARSFDRALSSADLAIIHALAGRKDEAIRTAQRAVEDLRTSASIVEINDVSSALALAYARTGEPDKALDLIEHLLTAPCQVQRGAIYNMTLTDLKWRWIWDPLRGNPRFQKLLALPEPKTIY